MQYRWSWELQQEVCDRNMGIERGLKNMVALKKLKVEITILSINKNYFKIVFR